MLQLEKNAWMLITNKKETTWEECMRVAVENVSREATTPTSDASSDEDWWGPRIA
jgi:hypothetical protein